MTPGRSLEVGDRGMAATSHPAATLAAVDILRFGGNAIDATIAVVAVQGVIDPHITGIGGDCFAIYTPALGPSVAINGSGRAPAKKDLEKFLSRGMTSIPDDSPHAVTVPGGGQPIVEHPGLDAIVFVGSEATGRKIGETCGRMLKKVILELGGKDPLIIDETVDVARAAAFAVDAAYFNAGQLCTATERIYVAREVFEPFIEALTRHSIAIVQDDGLADNVGMGPIVDRIQLDKIVDQVARFVTAGAVVRGCSAKAGFTRPR